MSYKVGDEFVVKITKDLGDGLYELNGVQSFVATRQLLAKMEEQSKESIGETYKRGHRMDNAKELIEAKVRALPSAIPDDIADVQKEYYDDGYHKGFKDGKKYMTSIIKRCADTWGES